MKEENEKVSVQDSAALIHNSTLSSQPKNSPPCVAKHTEHANGALCAQCLLYHAERTRPRRALRTVLCCNKTQIRPHRGKSRRTGRWFDGYRLAAQNFSVGPLNATRNDSVPSRNFCGRFEAQSNSAAILWVI